MTDLKQILANISARFKVYLIIVICLTAGWFGRQIFSSINSNPISYRTDVDISYALDERGRLHIVDLQTQHTVILSDSVALGIQAQVASRVYQDYMQKTK